jgi:hypothetical protein
VREVGLVLSMYVGPNDALVTMDLDFEASTTAAEAATAIFDVERAMRERSPVIKWLFIETDAAASQRRWSRPDSVAGHGRSAAQVAERGDLRTERCGKA